MKYLRSHHPIKPMTKHRSKTNLKESDKISLETHIVERFKLHLKPHSYFILIPTRLKLTFLNFPTNEIAISHVWQ